MDNIHTEMNYKNNDVIIQDGDFSDVEIYSEHLKTINEFMVTLYNLRTDITSMHMQNEEEKKAIKKQIKLMVNVINIYNNPTMIELFAKNYLKQTIQTNETDQNDQKNNSDQTMRLENDVENDIDLEGLYDTDGDITEDEYCKDEFTEMLVKSHNEINRLSALQQLTKIEKIIHIFT